MKAPSTAAASCAWLREDEPFSPPDSAAQINGLIGMFDASRSIIDLGCGGGRTLIPLAQHGHELLGLDRSKESLERCRAKLREVGATAQLRNADFLAEHALEHLTADAVLCLGNTFMTVSNVGHAAGLLKRIRTIIAPRQDGMFLIDDLPGRFWPEVAEGNWQNGVSEDGSLQFIWESRDAVFTLRRGDAVDPESWLIGPEEPRYRLWTDADLALVAARAGLSAPARDEESNLLCLRPLPDEPAVEHCNHR